MFIGRKLIIKCETCEKDLEQHRGQNSTFDTMVCKNNVLHLNINRTSEQNVFSNTGT